MHARRTSVDRVAPRPGFTLIELLVVITLILFLAGIAIAYLPAAMEGQRAADGGTKLQGWLLTAKQRALLDRAPRGVRLFPDNDTPQFVTTAQYIEQPDDFIGGSVATTIESGSAVLTKLTFTGIDLSGGLTDPVTSLPAPQAEWPVQTGDYIEIQGSGLMHRISAVTSSTTITLDSPLTNAVTTATPNYRIVRAPRPLGEETLLMPTYVGIDLKTNTDYVSPLPPANPDGSIDILFSPSGSVLGNSTGTDRIILWVRDFTLQSEPNNPLPNEYMGTPSLIVVFTRSGLTSAYEVDQTVIPGTPPTFTPYSFVR